jgi:hypothetical protein
MKSLPLPLRIAAGLAVTAVERARTLPQQLASLPVTVASQALQLSMRVQQCITELAIKGDEVLAPLHPAQDRPQWATFDENEPTSPEPDLTVEADPAPTSSPAEPSRQAPTQVAEESEDTDYQPVGERNGVSPSSVKPKPAPAALPGYDELSLPQLRARLRRLSLAQLEELLSYERSHAGRPPFVGMLSRRIQTGRSQG